VKSPLSFSPVLNNTLEGSKSSLLKSIWLSGKAIMTSPVSVVSMNPDLLFLIDFTFT